MTEKQRVFVRGVKGRGTEVIKMLEDLGGSYKQFGKVQDLKIGLEKPNSQLWAIFSNGRQLTNRMF